MMTAFASTATAISAMKEGAYDYITKPFKVDEIRVVVEKALEKKLLSSENRRLRSELRSHVRDRSIIGHSAPMRGVLELVAQVADTRANVLVAGESGTGKEMVARAIHRAGERRDQPFVAVNCGAIPENLLESELFGHVKGSFTGAVQNKAGLFEVAAGGTLFLDEIGEMGLSLQVKILRAIQERAFRRVGGTSDIQFDARLVAASNRRLEEEVAAGRFREDLYYRLNVIEIPLPSLRERRDDIPLLVGHFIEKYAHDLGKQVRAVALTRGDTIELGVLPRTLTSDRRPTASARIPSDGVDLDALMNDYERGLLLEALEHTRGVKKRAAQLLGITFRSFRYRLEKLGLDESGGHGPG
jgi:two-component system response regulator PilR (NtrC family)